MKYTEENIRSLDWREHIRMRPGMYIGKLGDGSSPDDGIYVLVKETIDNSIDEYLMGFGKKIELKINEGDCAVIIDGHGGDYVKPGSEFIIEKGEPFKRVSIIDQSFYNKFKIISGLTLHTGK